MTLDQIFSFAAGELYKWGLVDWTFDLHNKRRALGTCFYGSRTIAFSRNFLHLADEVIKNTIRHEIAHALTPNAGHGPRWQRAAVMVGADPKRTAHVAPEQMAAAKWAHRCASCTKVVSTYYRRPTSKRRQACSDCCRKHAGGRFDARFELQLIEVKQ